jgi:hypothetical protein
MPALDSAAGTIDVEVIPMRSVLSTVYLQLPNRNMTFIDFSLTNKGDRSETVMIESEILGYSERAISTVNVPSHGTVIVGQTPVLKPSLIPREMTTAPLDYRVTFRDGALIKESTEPIRVYAKDTIVWAVLEGGEWIDISEFIGAWVTPHDPSIDTLVRRAAEYHPSHTMEGYQCGDCSDEEWSEYTDLQVQALFEALKRDYHITYINTPIAFGLDTENPQRVRLPFDSISTGSANCIDGTVLYASALEAL